MNASDITNALNVANEGVIASVLAEACRDHISSGNDDLGNIFVTETFKLAQTILLNTKPSSVAQQKYIKDLISKADNEHKQYMMDLYAQMALHEPVEVFVEKFTLSEAGKIISYLKQETDSKPIAIKTKE